MLDARRSSIHLSVLRLLVSCLLNWVSPPGAAAAAAVAGAPLAAAGRANSGDLSCGVVSAEASELLHGEPAARRTRDERGELAEAQSQGRPAPPQPPNTHAAAANNPSPASLPVPSGLCSLTAPRRRGALPLDLRREVTVFLRALIALALRAPAACAAASSVLPAHTSSRRAWLTVVRHLFQTNQTESHLPDRRAAGAAGSLVVVFEEGAVFRAGPLHRHDSSPGTIPASQGAGV